MRTCHFFLLLSLFIPPIAYSQTTGITAREERQLNSLERRIASYERRQDRYSDRVDRYDEQLLNIESEIAAETSERRRSLLERRARRLERRITRIERRSERLDQRISRLEDRIDTITGGSPVPEENSDPLPAEPPEVVQPSEPVADNDSNPVQPAPNSSPPIPSSPAPAPAPAPAPQNETPADTPELSPPPPPIEAPVEEEAPENETPNGCTIDWTTAIVQPQDVPITISGVVEQEAGGSWQPIGEGSISVKPGYTGQVVLEVEIPPSTQVISETGRMVVEFETNGIGVEQIVDIDLSTCDPTGVPLNIPQCGGNVSGDAIVVDFENHPVGSPYLRELAEIDWLDRKGGGNPANNNNQISNEEAQCGSQSLKATYTPDGRWGLDMWVGIPPRNEYYLSYWVYFEPGFDFDGPRFSGGKMPGLTAKELCVGGMTCNGSNGFSARYMWREGGTVVLYLYYMDKPGQFGEDMPLQDSSGNTYKFKPGTWHNLVQRIRINDPSGANGSLDVWFDGNLALSRTGLRFMTNGDQIEAVYFSSFFGGSGPDWQPERTVSAYFDNFVVSPSRDDVL